MENVESLYVAGGKVKWYSHGNSLAVPKKVKNRIVIDPAIPVLGIYPN